MLIQSFEENESSCESTIETNNVTDMSSENKKYIYKNVPENEIQITSNKNSNETDGDCSSTKTNKSIVEGKLSNDENLKNPLNVPKKKIYKRKPVFCYFCETSVLNFSRHIRRNHPCELEVVEIFAKKAKSCARKRLIDLLRKKGNYLKNSNECFKPVREFCISNQSYLPCDNCLGFYSKRLLHRHRNKCSRNKAQGSAQFF